MKLMYDNHTFYCINCGKKGIPIMRKQGHQHKSFHRKKLYCPFCKLEVNHVECKTYADEMEFKEQFEAGVFKEEAAQSIAYIQAENKIKVW